MITAALLGALGPLTSSFAQAPAAPARVFVSHASLAELWQRATSGRPLGEGALAFLTTNLGPPRATRPAGGLVPVGGGLIPPGGVVPATPTDVPPTALLPVVTPPGELSRELHRRGALLELLLSNLAGYVDVNEAGQVDGAGTDAELARADERRAWTAAAHLELFVVYAAFYLEGETKDDKCRAFERATEHARYLGWPATSRAASGAAAPALPLPPAFQTLHAQAWALFTGGFATSVPPRLCELRPAVTRAEDESRARGEAHAAIAARVSSAMDAQLVSLAQVATRYTRLDDTSKVDVATRGIFALKRQVEDARSLYELVRTDGLLLERGSDDGAQSSLVARVEKQGDRLAEIQRNASSSSLALDEDATAAKAALAKYDAVVAGIVATLGELARTESLEPSSRERLAVCVSLPPAITSDNGAAFAASLAECLSRVAEVYSALKGRVGSHPDDVAFAQRASALSDAYIGYFRQQPR